MKKRFKRVYIEITNNCNFNCSFCTQDGRKKEFMTKEKFENIILKIKNYTDYIYLHVKGEPLLHPNINEFIDFAYKNNINVNITTNGSLINNLKTKNIRQINYSMQSTKDIEKIKETIQRLIEYIEGTQIYLSLRLWTTQIKENEDLIQWLKNKFKIENIQDKMKIGENIFLSIENEFIWPDLENKEIFEDGFCYGLKDHIGILVDGTVVPCCLDHKGNIALGNIFEQDIEEIINNKRAEAIIEGFNKRSFVEELCKKCNFLSRREK